MAFRVKDLMISFAPAPEQKAIAGCGRCTICTLRSCLAYTCGYCTDWSCDRMSCMWSNETIVPYARAGSPGELAAVKEQLRQELARIEQQEAESQGAEPQTVEEIDELEGKLNEALKELQARRKALQQGGSKKKR